MSLQELKQRITELNEAEQREIHAFVYKLRNSTPDRDAVLQARLDDKDPSHWMSVDEFERRLDALP